jgi:hypothetical protein
VLVQSLPAIALLNIYALFAFNLHPLANRLLRQPRALRSFSPNELAVRLVETPLFTTIGNDSPDENSLLAIAPSAAALFSILCSFATFRSFASNPLNSNHYQDLNMAFPQTVGGGAPKTIEQIRSCLEDPDENGTSRRHIGGRMKRDRLAAIASSNLGLDATRKPWIGHILALLSESLDTSVINKIMTEGPGRYQKEWDKWDLAEGRPAWENRRGEDKIRTLVYDLLMHDLIILYEGYEVDGGLQVSRRSIKEVCKKVKDEIGLVVIKYVLTIISSRLVKPTGSIYSLMFVWIVTC